MSWNLALLANALENKIDQAYRTKYASSCYVSAMMGSRTKASTIEILAA